MTSRMPYDHSFVPYTGKSYIYWNGVPVPRKPYDPKSEGPLPNSRETLIEEHPYRTIRKTNQTNK